MPEIIVYTDPLKPGTAQMPVFTVGDDPNWSIRFNNGSYDYDPTNVTMNIGYVKGIADGSYSNSFQWIDRMNNRHTGSFVVSGGLADTMTWDENPLAVAGGSGSWLLSGRTPPSNSLRRIYINDQGQGYGVAPTVIIPPQVPNRTATGTVIFTSGGAATGVQITDGGFGYDSAPTMYFGATSAVVLPSATAVIRGGSVVGITSFSGGVTLVGATVAFASPTGAAAAGTATLGGASSAIASVALANGGSGYTSAPSVAITGGGGASGAATAALQNATWGIASITVTNAGSGYTSAPTISFSGGTGSGAAAVATVDTKDAVASVTITNGGTYTFISSGQSFNPTYYGGVVSITISGGSGTGAAVRNWGTWASLAGNYYTLSSIEIASGGSGYVTPPTVTVNILDATVATQISAPTLTAVLTNGAVTGIVVTNPGSGYTSMPTVVFSSGAAAGTAVAVGSPVGSVTLTNAGSGYTSVPTVGFSGGGGSGASAVATLVNTPSGVDSIVLTARGMGYTSLPAISFSMDGSSSTSRPCLAEASGIESHSIPFLQKFSPPYLRDAVTATPYTTGRRDSSGNLVYDDSLLVVRPRYLVQPTLTRQTDGLTWAGVFNPVNTFVTALLNYRRTVTADVEIYGGGRLLYTGSLTIQRA